MRVFHLILSESEVEELSHASRHSSLPYVRERASAILKVSMGNQLKEVGSSGLLQKRQARTISGWIARYKELGLKGLAISNGRGRKPSFSPCT